MTLLWYPDIEKSPVQVKYRRWSRSCPRLRSWPQFPGRKVTRLDLTVLVPCLKRWVVPMISTPFPAPMEMEIEALEPLQCKGQDPPVPLILKSTLCSLRGHQRLQKQWVSKNRFLSAKERVLIFFSIFIESYDKIFIDKCWFYQWFFSLNFSLKQYKPPGPFFRQWSQ